MPKDRDLTLLIWSDLFQNFLNDLQQYVINLNMYYIVQKYWREWSIILKQVYEYISIILKYNIINNWSDSIWIKSKKINHKRSLDSHPLCKHIMKFVSRLIFKVFYRIDYNTLYAMRKQRMTLSLSGIACKCKTRPAGTKSYLLRRCLDCCHWYLLIKYHIGGQSLDQFVSLIYRY